MKVIAVIERDGAIYDEKGFSLITEQASENILQIHHRQPVILNQKDIKSYLDLQLDEM